MSSGLVRRFRSSLVVGLPCARCRRLATAGEARWVGVFSADGKSCDVVCPRCQHEDETTEADRAERSRPTNEQDTRLVLGISRFLSDDERAVLGPERELSADDAAKIQGILNARRARGGDFTNAELNRLSALAPELEQVAMMREASA